MSSSPRASVGSEPVTAEDCGRDCGAASRTGREHLQGSSPPDIHWMGRRPWGRASRRSQRVRARLCNIRAGSSPFFLDGAAGKAL